MIEAGGILIVAPHSDDAALSVGGSIPLLRRPVAMITVFGRSNATQRGFEADWEGVTSLRREEDRVFAERHGLDWTYLDFPTAGFRLDGDFKAMTPAAELTEQALADDLRQFGDGIRDQLSKSLDRLESQIIMLPASIGKHRDHRVVREVARTIAAERGIAIVYYEDLPYANAYAEEQIVAWMAALDPRLQPVCVPIEDTLEAKLDRARLYESQVNKDMIEGLRYAARRYGQPMERLWTAESTASFLMRRP